MQLPACFSTSCNLLLANFQRRARVVRLSLDRGGDNTHYLIIAPVLGVKGWAWRKNRLTVYIGWAPKVLAQREPLLLVRRTNRCAIKFIWLFCHLVVYQSANQLAIFQYYRNFMGSDFQYGLRPFNAIQSVPESRVEEPCVVGAELANRRVIRDHFARISRWDANFLC